MTHEAASQPGILLDVDGTLVESTYFHALAWWRALRDAGEEIALYRIHRLIGMGGDRILEELLGEFRPELDKGHSEHFEALKDEVIRFPEVPELLSELARRGARAVLATSAKPEQVEHLTKLIGAEDDIYEVVSSGDVEDSKPAPDIFQSALEKARLDPSNTLALGDSTWDVEAAAKCGVKCVCLLTGGISEAELKSAGAIAVYQDPADLLANLDESPLGRLLAGERLEA